MIRWTISLMSFIDVNHLTVNTYTLDESHSSWMFNWKLDIMKALSFIFCQPSYLVTPSITTQ